MHRFSFFAMLLVLPAALWPRAHDSFWIDWVWADQFTSELRRGVPYPRWLPSSHGGLGSPVFYYYPPLAFYVSGLLGLAGLSTYASVIGAFALGLAASGAAMYLWLKEWTRLPLHGALFYMAAPYHLYDIYGRGALAETMAIAFIPLVALGIRRVSKDQGILVLALAYAGLVTTHLPLALLTSLLFVVPYGMLIVRKQPKTLWSLGLALASGIGLSAIYLLPALALEPFRDVAALYPMPGYRPENWSLAFPGAGAVNLVRGLITAIVVTLLVPTLYLIIKERSGWAAYAAICCLLMSGLVPLIWRLPLLDSVQFPYRMLPLAEFGIGTALALAPSSSRLLALAAFPPLALSVFFVTAPADNKAPEKLSALRTSYPDVPEHLPPGSRPYTLPSQWALGISALHKSPKRVGETTILPTFYFPSRSIRCAGGTVPSFPNRETKLLSSRGSDCTARLRWTAAERAGALTSIGSLAIILFLTQFPKRRRQGGSASEARAI